jgi:hypothetical protein
MRQTNMFKLGGMKKTPEPVPAPEIFKRGSSETLLIALTKSEIASGKYSPAIKFAFSARTGGDIEIIARWKGGTEHNEGAGDGGMIIPKRVWLAAAPWIMSQLEKAP